MRIWLNTSKWVPGTTLTRTTNVYAAYKFNQLDDNDYTKAAGVATDDQAAVGIVYQF
ncbi:porin [Klebsiella pneumoniae subsp. pneumoniae]|nr:porin [Klebsiella pneumoniae subsp. pneumoniae]